MEIQPDNRTIEQKLEDSEIAYRALADSYELQRQALRSILNVYFIELAHEIAQKGLDHTYGTLTKGK